MLRWVFAAALIAAVTACGPPVAPEAADGVEGQWVLVEGVETVDEYPITLAVSDGRVGGAAACNSYGGDVTLDAGRFVVGELAHTKMGCPEPGVHDSEAAYLRALVAVERHERQGDQLVLLGPGVELRFDMVTPPEDAPLTDTLWRLEGLVQGAGPDAAVSSTVAPAWLRLDEAGGFAASDGCNELTGRWRLDGDMLRLSDVSTTDVACPDVGAQVDHVHGVLLGEPAVEHDGRRLLLTADGQALDYRAD